MYQRIETSEGTIHRRTDRQGNVVGWGIEVEPGTILSHQQWTTLRKAATNGGVMPSPILVEPPRHIPWGRVALVGGAASGVLALILQVVK